MPRITITIDVPDGTAVNVGGQPAPTHRPNNMTPAGVAEGLASEKQQRMIWARAIHGAGMTKEMLADLIEGISGVRSLKAMPFRFVDPILQALAAHQGGGTGPNPRPTAPAPAQQPEQYGVEDDDIPF